MTLAKRSFLPHWLAAAGHSRCRPSAADMIGNCELSGKKGRSRSPPRPRPASSRSQVSLPAPIWWNGDTPEAIKDGMEYCMAAEIAWRAGYDKLEVVNVGWDPLVTGQTSGFDLALSQISITEERKKVVDFSVPYFSSDIGVLARADAPVDEKTIKDRKVGVQQATTGAPSPPTSWARPTCRSIPIRATCSPHSAPARSMRRSPIPRSCWPKK